MQALPKLPEQTKSAVVAVAAASLPCHGPGVREWCGVYLQALAAALKVDDATLTAFAPLQPLDQAAAEPLDLSGFTSLFPEDPSPILKDLILLVALTGRYDARARTVQRRVTAALGAAWPQVVDLEAAVAAQLGAELRRLQRSADEEEDSSKKHKRWLKVGLAAAGGATLLALTGGLAAPFLLTGVAALGTTGASVASLIAATGGITTLTAIFGTTGAGLAGYKMKRRTESVQEFEFQEEATSSEERGMHLVICVSGWLSSQHDVQKPWGVRSTAQDAALMRKRLKAFYKVHNPEKLRDGSIDRIMGEYSSSSPPPGDGDAAGEELLFQRLRAKYCGGATPPAPPTVDAVVEGASAVAVDETAAAVEGASAIVVEGEATAVETEAEGAVVEGEAVVEEEEKTAEETEAGGAVVEGEDTEAEDEEAVLVEAISEAEAEAQDSIDPDQDPSLSSWNWREVMPHGEHYTLRWESDILIELGKSVKAMAVGEVSDYALKTFLKTTVLSAVLSALTWPLALIKLADAIDNVWSMAVERADEAGKILASVLLERHHGSRPVTLIGYSMGSRLIYSCLRELAASGDAGAGIVENVVLMGSPLNRGSEGWTQARSVVAGRFVNCYSTKDWMLSFMFRAQNWSLQVAGIAPVDVLGVENVDVTSIVGGHGGYSTHTKAVLELVDIDGEALPPDLSPRAVAGAAVAVGEEAEAGAGEVEEFKLEE